MAINQISIDVYVVFSMHTSTPELRVRDECIDDCSRFFFPFLRFLLSLSLVVVVLFLTSLGNASFSKRSMNKRSLSRHTRTHRYININTLLSPLTLENTKKRREMLESNWSNREK